MPEIEIVKEQLKRHEGLAKWNKTKTLIVPYTDSRGYLTIGYGICIDSFKGGLTLEECETLLKMRIDKMVAEINRDKHLSPIYKKCNTYRKAVLINMAFNMGLGTYGSNDGLLGFKNTLAYIKAGDYEQASVNMLQSLWAKQVKGRANELAKIMKNGYA